MAEWGTEDVLLGTHLEQVEQVEKQELWHPKHSLCNRDTNAECFPGAPVFYSCATLEDDAHVCPRCTGTEIEARIPHSSLLSP